MPLTPEDVQNKRFSTVRFKEGYDEEEVDAFLDEVEAELRRLLGENTDLRSWPAAAAPPLTAQPPGAQPPVSSAAPPARPAHTPPAPCRAAARPAGRGPQRSGAPHVAAGTAHRRR